MVITNSVRIISEVYHVCKGYFTGKKRQKKPNCIGGVMVSVLPLNAVEGGRWVQAMLRLNQRLKIRIMCQSGLTCVPLDFCFSVLV